MQITDVLYRFLAPELEHVTGSSKIPSVLYYDEDGTVRAVGAETEGIYEMAEDGGWIKVEGFVRFFRPQEIKLNEPCKVQTTSTTQHGGGS